MKNKINISKKLLAFLFTICMLIYNISCIPVNLTYATNAYNLTMNGFNNVENQSFIYKVDGCTAGKLEVDSLSAPSSTHNGCYTFSGIKSGTYKITITSFNGYTFNNLKVNDTTYSASACSQLTDNVYTYNLEIDGSTRNLSLEAEFKSNMTLNSNKKIYVNGTLCIDELSNPILREYSGAGFDVYPAKEQGGYVIDIKSGTSIGNVVAEGNPNLIIQTHGSANIQSADGFSIRGVKNLTIFDVNSSEEALDLKGGVNLSGELNLQKNINIGSQEEFSTRGIEGSKSLLVENSKLSIYSSGSAFKNISSNVLIGSRGTIDVTCETKLCDNVSKVSVKEGGKINISSKTEDLGTILYSVYTHWNDKLWNLNSPPTTTETKVNIHSESQTQEKYNYTSKHENGYYIWNLASLEDPTVRLLYGTDPLGLESSVLNGEISVLSGVGQRLDNSAFSSGLYKLKNGSNVTVSILPNYGYQINADAVKSLSMIPQENLGEYTFNVPSLNIDLTNIFVKSEDIIKVDSNCIKDASIEIPEGIIHGNARFTLKSNIPENTEDFTSKAGEYNISNYFDITLEEIVYKNGSAESYWSTELKELKKPMKITLELNDNIKNHNKYCILRSHNDDISKLDANYDASTGKLVFTTDKYSEYAIGSSEQLRTLETSVVYNNETLKIIVQDSNNVLCDSAELVVTLVQEGSDRYKELKANLDSTHNPNNIAFFDIVIYKNTNHKEHYTQLDKTVNLLFQIPSGWNKNDLQAVLVSENEDTEFDEEIVTKDGLEYVSFWTDHFSPYSFLDQLNSEDIDWEKLAEELESSEPEEPIAEESVEDEDTTPEVFATGDNTKVIIICVAAVAVVSIIALMFLRRSDKKK